MATVKKYKVICRNCTEALSYYVFASLYHTIDARQWLEEKTQNCDCKAILDQQAKDRAPRPLNPIKASKKGK
ncbi:MAG: hypothetical protein SF339_24020 [Blastocatellia bacterium]|nr:hypothetical protein [Blastocatellia bacterium]